MKNWRHTMRRVRPIRLAAPLGLSLLVTILLLSAAICAADVVVQPGQGVSFSQVNFTWQPGAVPDSDRGSVEVHILTLTGATGIREGFINVVTGLGWVVQNLAVFAGFPYPTISTMFQISMMSGVDIRSLPAYVLFSADPLSSAPTPSAPLPTFPVGSVDFNARGVERPTPIPDPEISRFAAAATLFQGPLALSVLCVQPPHTDIETAINQCVPQGAANGFQWLSDQYGTTFPFDHIPGLAGVPANSLVGNLDVLMARPVGEGTCIDQGLEGKLEFLANNDLGTQIAVQHQDDAVFCGAVGGGNFTAHGLTSTGQGIPTTAFIQDEVCRGEAVEIAWSWAGGGGHSVNVVATWTILGEPYIAWTTDTIQGAPGGIAVQSSRLPTVGGIPQVVDIDPVDGGVHTVVSQAPIRACFGIPATIFVANGLVFGGPDDGQPYRGVLRGTQADDVIVGTGGSDIIYGMGGNDLICGGAGDDILNSGPGDDNLDGGAGNDILNAGAGNDILIGGPGNDILNGGAGDDELEGGLGNDVCDGGVGVDSASGCEVVGNVP
jgi:hypothetical protein